MEMKQIPVSEHEKTRIGATIQTFRTMRGYRPDEFANELNISRSHLTNIEAGRKALTPQLLKRAAEALHVRPIAIIREGYFDKEKVEHQIAVTKARQERDKLLTEIKNLRQQLCALEKTTNAINIPT